MDFTQIITSVVQFGFPAVWSVLILWYCTKQIETHKEETKGFTEAIQKNTETINELKIMIQMMMKEDKS